MLDHSCIDSWRSLTTRILVFLSAIRPEAGISHTVWLFESGLLFGPREGGKRAWSELGAIYYYLVSERVAARLGRGCVLPVCVAVCAHRCIDSLSERALFERSNAPYLPLYLPHLHSIYILPTPYSYLDPPALEQERGRY